MRILEEISEYLFDIGSTGDTSAVINTLALDLTRNLTGVELVVFARDVFPIPYSRHIEGYLSLEFPLLYASIVSSLANGRCTGMRTCRQDHVD